MKRKLKKTVEEQLKEQGLHHVSIDELLCPKKQSSQTFKAPKNKTTKGEQENGIQSRR